VNILVLVGCSIRINNVINEASERNQICLLGILVLDLITHRPDLQLFPWSDIRLGLGLWNSVVFTMLVEILIYCVGAYLYMMNRKEENKKGKIGVLSLLIILFGIYLMNIFGSVPPSEEAIGYAGLSLWLFVAWAYWIDRKDVIKI
jgi:hypothetical protein